MQIGSYILPFVFVLPAIMPPHRENDNQISPPSASWWCKRIQDVLGCDVCLMSGSFEVASSNWQLISWRPIENRVLVSCHADGIWGHLLPNKNHQGPFLSHSSADYNVLLVIHIELQMLLFFPSCLWLVVKSSLAFCRMRQGLLMLSW